MNTYIIVLLVVFGIALVGIVLYLTLKPKTASTVPVDCAVSSWSNWSSCSASCGGGSQTQTRTVTTASSNGGALCPALTQTQSCNTQPCPVDCAYTWVDDSISGCSVTCGSGTKTQHIQISISGSSGGRACPTNTTQTVACNTQACPINCAVTPWSAWSACSSTGSQTQTRTITTNPANGGTACPILIQAQSCPVDCVVNWINDTSNCSVSGFMSQTASVTPQLNGGNCSVANGAKRTVSCTNPVDCVVSGWTDVSACSVACGGGSKTQTRSILSQAIGSGNPCSAFPLSQTISCNTQACPVNCAVSTWGACVNGNQTRTVTTPAANGGTACPALTQSCQLTNGSFPTSGKNMAVTFNSISNITITYMSYLDGNGNWNDLSCLTASNPTPFPAVIVLSNASNYQLYLTDSNNNEYGVHFMNVNNNIQIFVWGNATPSMFSFAETDSSPSAFDPPYYYGTDSAGTPLVNTPHPISTIPSPCYLIDNYQLDTADSTTNDSTGTYKLPIMREWSSDGSIVRKTLFTSSLSRSNPAQPTVATSSFTITPTPSLTSGQYIVVIGEALSGNFMGVVLFNDSGSLRTIDLFNLPNLLYFSGSMSG